MIIAENNHEMENFDANNCIKNFQIITADGAYFSLNKDQSSILFYTQVPFLKKGKNHETDICQSEMLQVEIRMQSKHLQGLIETMLKVLEKKLKQKNDGEAVTSDRGMFA
jgi:hypothetical protein